MQAAFEHWKQLERVLCVRPDNLGDVLMTTPAIRALKQARENRHITLLTSRAGASVARHVPEVDEVEVFEPPWYRHERAGARESITEIAARLREHRYDGAVIFTVFSQNPLPNAMLCYMAGIPRVAGFCRENPYELMTDWIPDTEPLYGARHEVRRQLELVKALGAQVADTDLSLDIPRDRQQDVVAALENAGVQMEHPWLLLHAGASEARRRYPPERFAAVARALHAQLGMQVVLTGSRDEVELAHSVARMCESGVVSIAGQLDMSAFITLVAMAPMIVSNNTGPVHIAAAVRTPVVVLYALTNPQHAPWRVPSRVIPFDVPPSERSRNVLVRFASDQYFTGSAGLPDPADVVAAVAELLETPSNKSSSHHGEKTGLVSVAARDFKRGTTSYAQGA